VSVSFVKASDARTNATNKRRTDDFPLLCRNVHGRVDKVTRRTAVKLFLQKYVELSVVDTKDVMVN